MPPMSHSQPRPHMSDTHWMPYPIWIRCPYATDTYPEIIRKKINMHYSDTWANTYRPNIWIRPSPITLYMRSSLALSASRVT
uniref:Uncharacterized protein n=1 Tax=Arundo donax TaxID=35708 RepID=A0A0A9FJI2_ARUDO